VIPKGHLDWHHTWQTWLGATNRTGSFGAAVANHERGNRTDGQCRPGSIPRALRFTAQRSLSACRRITSRWGCPHRGHFSSRMSWPTSISFTRSANRRLHPAHRTWVWRTFATLCPSLPSAELCETGRATV